MSCTRPFFFFEPQTGLIRPRAPLRSNFHNYRLSSDPKTIAFVEAAVEKARPGSGGLEYPKTFLNWLDKTEKKCSRR